MSATVETQVELLTRSRADAPTREELRAGWIRTEMSRPVAWGVVIVFVAMVVAVPISQAVVELLRDGRVQAMDVLTQWPSQAANRQFEEALEGASVLRELVRPKLQYALVRFGGFGNGNTVIGREGWLFYLPGVEYAGGHGFLDQDVMRQRIRAAARDGEETSPDAVAAIEQFHRELAKRGVRLVVMPVPDKANVEGGMLGRRLATRIASNTDFGKFVERLRGAGVDVFDPTPKAAGERHRFLRQDTHWRPEWMEEVAGDLAGHVTTMEALSARPSQRWRVEEQRVGQVGDLVRMLGLGEEQKLFAPEEVTIRQVLDSGGGAWQSSRRADVLLLGDSFTNIYSSPELGWGESAGFAEHLSRFLGRPIDVIARNDGGASGCREMLARELASGRDRLAGKKVVIWEFAARELACGDWRRVELAAGRMQSRRALALRPGEQMIVTGVVEERSAVPRPGRVPYKDHIMSVVVGDVVDAKGERGEAMVYLWSMRDGKQTEGASLRVGQRVKLRLTSWEDVAAKLERINRSEIAGSDLLDSACWGEVIK